MLKRKLYRLSLALSLAATVSMTGAVQAEDPERAMKIWKKVRKEFKGMEAWEKAKQAPAPDVGSTPGECLRLGE